MGRAGAKSTPRKSGRTFMAATSFLRSISRTCSTVCVLSICVTCKHQRASTSCTLVYWKKLSASGQGGVQDYKSATKKLRIVGFRVGDRSRGRFATPADFPR